MSRVQLLIRYVNTETLLLSMLPILYGLATIFVGDELWVTAQSEGAVPVYQTVLKIPGAPESVGCVFILCGIFMIFFNWGKQRWGRWLAVSCFATACVLFGFSMTFVYDIFSEDAPQAWPPFFVYLILSSVMANRAGLAWAWTEKPESIIPVSLD